MVLIVLIILIVFKITIYQVISGNHVKYNLFLTHGYNLQPIVIHEIIKFVVYSVLYSLGIFVLIIRRKNNTIKTIPWGELFWVAISISFILAHVICFVLAFIITIDLNIQIDIFYTVLTLFILYFFWRYSLRTGSKVTITIVNIVGWVLSILYIIFGILVVYGKLT